MFQVSGAFAAPACVPCEAKKGYPVLFTVKYPYSKKNATNLFLFHFSKAAAPLVICIIIYSGLTAERGSGWRHPPLDTMS